MIKFHSMSMHALTAKTSYLLNDVNICVVNFFSFFLFLLGCPPRVTVVNTVCIKANDTTYSHVVDPHRYRYIPMILLTHRTFESKFPSKGIAVPWHLFHRLPRVTSEFRMQRVVWCFVIDIQTTNTKLYTP